MSSASRSSLARCLAQVVGCALHEVPLPDAGEDPVAAVTPWLGGRGLGLVAVADPGDFGWAGAWVAQLADGRFVLRFGAPDSGTIDDPAGGDPSAVARGWVVAPHDLTGWEAPRRGAPGEGTVVAVLVAETSAAPCRPVATALAVPGRGLEGDRYWSGRGAFPSGRPGADLTLVDAAVLDELGIAPELARRNVVVAGVDLDALIGREFTVGDVRCVGRRRCEPCAHLERLADRPVLRPLVHRGGLRADVLGPGSIGPGDAVRATGD